MSELWNALTSTLGYLLSVFYDWIPNYGIAIIILTVLINVLLFPLTLKQTRSTRAFQEIQPEIRRLQKEYKDEPQTLQAELMKVQRAAGATPGGCLIPLLVQMPIWFALFRVLNTPTQANHIPSGTALYRLLEEGGARFLAMDLGLRPAAVVSNDGVLAALPYLTLLVLMVVTQFVQQWHATPRNQAQGQQQKAQQTVTKMMPLLFGVISYNFPVGLVLYWATSNLFRLGQQALIFSLDGRPAPAAGREHKAEPAEEPAPPPPKRPQGSAKKRKRRRRK